MCKRSDTKRKADNDTPHICPRSSYRPTSIPVDAPQFIAGWRGWGFRRRKMSDNKPEKEMELKKFYLKWLVEHAKMPQSQIDPAKEEETFDTLAQYFSQMIDDWQL